MEKKIRKLEMEVADYEFHYDALEVDARGVIRNWDVDFKKEVVKKTAALKKVKNLERKVNEMKKEKKTMEKEMKKMRQKVEELEVQARQDGHRITDLVEENRDLRQSLKKKEEAAQGEVHKINQLEEEKEKTFLEATQEIDNLKLKNENLEKERNVQIQRNNLLQAQNIEVSARNDALEQEDEKLKLQVKIIKDLIKQVRNRNGQLLESGRKIKIQGWPSVTALPSVYTT